MIRARTAALLVVVGFLLVSCDASNGGDVTPAATQAPVGTATPAAAPVPSRPAALADYPPVVADYVSANSAEGESCLADLLAAWSPPGNWPPSTCRKANTDADAELELVVVATAPVDSVLSYVVFVLDPAASGYDVAFESPSYPAPPQETTWVPLLYAGDLNGDGTGEVVYTSQLCVENRCFNSAYLLQGSSAGYVPIAPEAGIGVVDGLFEVNDVDGDATLELLATGTPAATPDGGPQRQIIETWAWDGASYVLRGTAPGKTSRYLYHRVLDADALLENGDYTGAENTYLSGVDDNDGLLLWKGDANERNELDAYALFRATLAHLLAGGDVETANGYLDRAKALPNTLHAQLAASFKAGYAAKGEIGVGCTAVNDDLRFNDTEYASFWDYGTDNPAFEPASFCPF